MHSTVVASYRRQHGRDVDDSEANALRQMLKRATERDANDGYKRTAGSVGIDAYADSAKAALDAMYDWTGVFAKAKLQGASSRSATSDGCALNLTLLAKEDSGGRVKAKRFKLGKATRGETVVEQAPLLPTAEGSKPIVVGGDFGRGGESVERHEWGLAAEWELHTGMAATALPPFFQQLFEDEALRRKNVDASQVTSVAVPGRVPHSCS